MSSRCIRAAMILSLIGALALLSELALAQPAQRGGVTGNVLGLDGNPVAGFTVKLVQDVPVDIGRRGRGGPSGGGTKTVGQTTTDAQGRFNFNNIEAGDYRLEGGNRNIGWLYENVHIEANKTVEMKDVRLVKVD